MRYRGLDDVAPPDQFEIDVLAGLALLREVLAPALEPVGPRLDRVAPASNPVRPEARDPAVVVVKRERRFPPILVLEGVVEHRLELVVAVAEQIGPYLDRVADDALGRITTRIDLG